jgi:hypothetical protein
MRYFLFILLPLALWAKVPLVAVEEISPRGVSQNDAAIITDRLRSELVQTGKVRVLERSEMDKILKEQGFQKSGACDQAECAVEAGKLLSVDRMAVGSVGKIGDLFTLSVRLLDVGTGEVVFTANQDYKGQLEDLLTECVTPLAAKLAVGALRTSGNEGPAMVLGAGDLYVTTDDQAATLLLDGKPVAGSSPFTIEKVLAGEHILVARTGSLYGSETVNLGRDDLLKVRIAMRKGEGKLKVFSNPPGALVVMDGQPLAGETPLKADHVPAGPHVVVVQAKGYFSSIQKVSVGLGDLAEVRATLSPSATLHLTTSVRDLDVLLTKDGDSLRVSWQESTLRSGGARLYSAAVQLAPGSWTVQVQGADWEPLSRGYRLGAGEDRFDTLEPVSHWAQLRIRANAPSLATWNQDTLGQVRGPGKGDALVAKVLAGHGRLCLFARGMDPWCDSVTLSGGESRDVEVKNVSKYATLDISSNLEAKVWLGDRMLGTTRISVNPPARLTCDTVPAGTFSMRLEVPDYEPWNAQVDLVNGMRTPVQAIIHRSKAWEDSSAHDHALKWRWITGSLGVAGAAMAVYFHADAINEKSLADKSHAAYQTATTASAADQAKADHGSHIDAANRSLHKGQIADAATALFLAAFGVTFAF